MNYKEIQNFTKELQEAFKKTKYTSPINLKYNNIIITKTPNHIKPPKEHKIQFQYKFSYIQENKQHILNTFNDFHFWNHIIDSIIIKKSINPNYILLNILKDPELLVIYDNSKDYITVQVSAFGVLDYL